MGYLDGALDSYSKAMRGGAGEEARARFEALLDRSDAATRSRFSGDRRGESIATCSRQVRDGVVAAPKGGPKSVPPRRY